MQTHSYPRELTLIPRPPEQVIGRAEKLETIRKNLEHYKAPIVLVNGIGGIGKTTVALEFIQQHGAAYPHLAWIEVTDTIPAAMVANKTLLKNLHLEAELETLPLDTYEAQAFDLIINTLNQLPACLLVIDNANNLDDLLRCEPRLRSLNAKTLVTSRAHPEDWTSVPIDELEPKEAFQLFLLYYDANNATGKTDLVFKILECLQHHTLLVELIAKAAYKASLPLETLYEKVQQNYLRDETLNLKLVNPGTHADHTKLPKQARIEHYITMVFQQISALSDTEQRYLRYMTLLPSNEYAESFLIEVFSYQPKAAKPTEPSKPQPLWQRLFNRKPKKIAETPKILTTDPKPEIIDSLELLAQKGWLTQKRAAQGCTYKLHSLIQDVATRELSVSYAQCAPVVDYWIAALEIDHSKDNPIEKFPLLPYGEFLIEKLQAEQQEEISNLLDNVGEIKWHLGKYSEAALLREKALAIDLALFGEKHPTVARRQSNLALVYKGLGQYEQARDLQEQNLKLAIEVWGKKHPEVSVRQSNLANVYRGLGQYERARDLLEKALANAIEHFGEKHPTVARRQSNLALVYQDLGQHERARDLLEKALASDIENFGEKHPNVAVDQSNLAAVYRDLGQHERARDLLEKALASDIENFGEKHPNVARCLNNLAFVEIALENGQAAKALLTQAYQIFYDWLGADHPNTKTVAKSLAKVEAQLGESSER